MKPSKSWVEISKKALTHNVGVFRTVIDTDSQYKVNLMTVLKSNAYGHGLTEVASIVHKNVDWFGVDSVDEGIALRKSDVRHPILVMGYTPKMRLRELIQHNLSFVVYNSEIIRSLKALSDVGHPIKVHIKIEAGTNRQGVAGEELRELTRAIKRAGNIEVEGAYTHFADVEEGTAFAKKQITLFNEGLAILKHEGIEPKLRHTACSAGILRLPEAHFDMVRLGISLYGLWSSPSTKNSILRRTGGDIILHPVLTWKTVVAQVKDVKKGTAVGYGCSEVVKKNSKIAVIPVGYYDGFDRHLSNKGAVLIRGKRCKIVGRICMNMCMVDVSGVKGVKMEDEVVLIGKQGKEEISAEEMANIVGTINYEIVTRINPLLPRVVSK
ncbi:MAG: alanine racemase [bacterium]|nr:alanine racemase [bacterium]